MTITEIQKTSGGHFYGLRDKLSRHIQRRNEECFERAARRRGEIKTAADFEAYQAYMRNEFISAMGGIPYDGSLPLNAKVVEVIREEQLTIEKVIFESRPKVYITANLYLPQKRKNPCGAVLFQCGHYPAGKHGAYQKTARTIALSGLIVLIFDPVGQGERYSYLEKGYNEPVIGSCTAEHTYAGAQCFLTGDCILRYFIADAMRGVDYLLTRPEVDPENIGATGHSGGGTMTGTIMICDPRIKAAAPGCFVMTRRSYAEAGGVQDDEQIWIGGTHYGFDHHEMLMCFAPKPLLVLAVDSDFFPIEGTKTVCDETRRFWEIYDKGDDFNLIADSSTHDYTDLMAVSAGRFFARHLNGEDRKTCVQDVKCIDESRLYCTPSGQIGADISDARFVYNENLERFNCIKGNTNDVEWIRKKINFERKPCDLAPRFYASGTAAGLYADFVIWFSQEYLPCYGVMLRDVRRKGETLPVVVCLWDKGTDDLESNMNKIREICDDGKIAFVVDLSGVGKAYPYPARDFSDDDKEAFGIIDKLNKDLLFLGDSLCALRTFDLERTVELLKSLPGIGEVSIYAKGFSAVYAQLFKIMFDEVEIHIEDAVNIRKIVTDKYYNNFNAASVIMPALAVKTLL